MLFINPQGSKQGKFSSLFFFISDETSSTTQCYEVSMAPKNYVLVSPGRLEFLDVKPNRN